MIVSTETIKLLKNISYVYRAINHKLRQQILNYIEECGRITVTDLYGHFMIAQSAMSQHLSILKSAGAVKIDRNGKFIFYSVNTDRMKQLIEIAKLLSE